MNVEGAASGFGVDIRRDLTVHVEQMPGLLPGTFRAVGLLLPLLSCTDRVLGPARDAHPVRDAQIDADTSKPDDARVDASSPDAQNMDASAPPDAARDGGDVDSGRLAHVGLDASEAADGAVDAGPRECTPGAVDCYVKTPRSCSDDGKWVRGTRCLDACHEGECVPCVPGSKRCEKPVVGDDKLSLCTSDHRWIPYQPCDAGVCMFVCEIPATCADQGLECGWASDGFAGSIDCDEEIGGCAAGFVCGTGAQKNHCVPVK